MKAIRIDKVPAPIKKAINATLDATIKEHGIEQTRSVIFNFFNRYKVSQKNKQRIAELKKEIASLKK